METAETPTWPKETHRSFLFVLKACIAISIISFIGGLIVPAILTEDVDNDAYCSAFQVEHRKTPEVCNTYFKDGRTKLVLALVLDADKEIRNRLAHQAYGEDENIWSRGLWQSIYGEFPTSKDRLSQYIAYSNYGQAEWFADLYSNSSNADTVIRRNTIQEYEKKAARNTAIEHRIQRNRALLHRWTWGMGLFILNILGLLHWRDDYKQHQSRRPIQFREALIAIALPFIAITAISSFLYRRWLADRVERMWLRIFFGKDIAKLFDESLEIRDSLSDKTISEESREALCRTLDEALTRMETLKQERRKTKSILTSKAEDLTPEIRRRITDLRERVEMTLRAEADIQTTASSLEQRFEALETAEQQNGQPMTSTAR